MYNPVTCHGWEDSTAGWIASGGCLGGRIGFVLLFFIIAILRKWVFETTGIPYNFFIGLLAGEFSYLIVLIIFGAFKWALIVGLVASIVGGIVGAGMYGESESGE